MKVTQAMIEAAQGAMSCDAAECDECTELAIQAVLDLIGQPEVEPFAFTGHPNLHVYLHPACGAVVDVDPAYSGIKHSINQQVQDGECDCENTSPWVRIYVEVKP